MNNYKIKHLEMLQAVVTRLANNSFQIKNWCLVLLGAIWGIALKDEGANIQLEGKLTCALILMFWILDSYYLQKERLFRNMYDRALQNEDDTSNRLILTPSESDENEKTHRLYVMFSCTEFFLYGVLLILNILLHWWENIMDWLECLIG